MQSPSTENNDNDTVQRDLGLLSTPKRQFVAQWIDTLSRPDSRGSSSSTENSIPSTPVISSVLKRLSTSPIASNRRKRFKKIVNNTRNLQYKTPKSETDESLKIDDNSIYSEPLNVTVIMPPQEIEHISDASFISPRSVRIIESPDSPMVKSKILKLSEKSICINKLSNQKIKPQSNTSCCKQLIKIINENEIPSSLNQKQNTDGSNNTDDNSADIFQNMDEKVQYENIECDISDASFPSPQSLKLTQIPNSQESIKRRSIFANKSIKLVDEKVNFYKGHKQVMNIIEKSNIFSKSKGHSNVRKRLSKIIEEIEDPNDSTEFIVPNTEFIVPENEVMVPETIPVVKNALKGKKERVIIMGTQVIDCDSSSESLLDTKPVECTSDSDKTVSDFIEEVCSQNICELSPFPRFHNICTSTPINARTEQTSITDPTTSANERTDNTCNITDNRLSQIFSTNTSESKVEFEQTVLPTENKRKKKRKLKKGSLEERMTTTINAERSNVHIWRHQAQHKLNELIDNRFVLLQIQTHYLLSNNQFFTCVVLEDSDGLFDEFVKKNKVVTIMTVPEISGKIAVKYETSLKAFRPWTILDVDVPLIHVSRFIILSSKYENQNSQEFTEHAHKSITQQKFDCPCIEENRISDRCREKFTDCKKNVIQEVFDYK